jgi:hypothetical protein
MGVRAMLAPARALAPVARMRLNRAVSTHRARFETLARTPSGAVACALNSNNANNNRTRRRLGDQA